MTGNPVRKDGRRAARRAGAPARGRAPQGVAMDGRDRRSLWATSCPSACMAKPRC